MCIRNLNLKLGMVIWQIVVLLCGIRSFFITDRLNAFWTNNIACRHSIRDFPSLPNDVWFTKQLRILILCAAIISRNSIMRRQLVYVQRLRFLGVYIQHWGEVVVGLRSLNLHFFSILHLASAKLRIVKAAGRNWQEAGRGTFFMAWVQITIILWFDSTWHRFSYYITQLILFALFIIRVFFAFFL